MYAEIDVRQKRKSEAVKIGVYRAAGVQGLENVPMSRSGGS